MPSAAAVAMTEADVLQDIAHDEVLEAIRLESDPEGRQRHWARALELTEQAYEVSGSEYRTWKPHVSPTLDGGIYVSVRIDHRRGVLASDDHASLELTFDGDGNVATARSTIALQGRKISSDLIEGGVKAGASVVGVERAAKVGTDLIGNLSAKLLREKVSEPGRVGFPAVLRHNYNLLILSVRQVDDRAVPSGEGTGGLAVRAVPVGEEEDRTKDGEVDKSPEPVDDESVEESEEGDAAQPPVVPPLEIDHQGKPREARLPVPAGE